MKEHDFTHPGQPPLSPDAAEALDAWIDARASGAPLNTSSPLFALLDFLDASHVHPDPSLCDLTFLRVARTAPAREPVLSDIDGEALDAWVGASYSASRVHGPLQPRARRIESLARLVTHAPLAAQPSSALTSRTLDRVQAAEDQAIERMQLHRRMRLPRLADIISVAAVLLIATSVVWPVMSAVREQGRRTICMSNLMGSTIGLASYADDNDSSLPVAMAGLGGRPWWDVGSPQGSNSANLFKLARDRYVGLDDLACPGNAHAPTALGQSDDRDWRRLEEVSYSYRIMFAADRPDWNANGDVVVLSDRSPVVLRAYRGQMIDPSENSPNHLGSGQHVLMNSGHAMWVDSPQLESGDNLWLPRNVERSLPRAHRPVRPISGTEAPESLDDAFVGP